MRRPDNKKTQIPSIPRNRPSSPTTLSGWTEGTGAPNGQAGISKTSTMDLTESSE